MVTDHVRRLCNTARVASPSLLRQAVQGCAFATLFYVAETWYSPQISQWALNQVKTAINRDARAVLCHGSGHRGRSTVYRKVVYIYL